MTFISLLYVTLPLFIHDNVSALANITMIVFRPYGFTPNFKPGKTEALVYFYGPGARVHKQLVYNVHDKRVRVKLHDHDFDVCVTEIYKHLGTSFVTTPAILPIIKQRFASVTSSTKSLRRGHCVSKDYQLRATTIATFIHMYLLSKALFDCCTLPVLSITEAKITHSHVMRLYKTFNYSY